MFRFSVMGTVASSLCECSGSSCKHKSSRRSRVQRNNCNLKNGNATEKFTLLAYYNSFIAAKASGSSSSYRDVDNEPLQAGHWPRSINGHKGFSEKHLLHTSDTTDFLCPTNDPFFRQGDKNRPSLGDVKSNNYISDTKNERLEATPNEKSEVLRDQKTQNNNLTVNNNSYSELKVNDGSKQQPINNNHESYLLSAPSQSDMDEWIKAIRRVILSPFGGGIFGQNLDETLRHDRRLASNMSIVSEKTGSPGQRTVCQVPIIVENCVEFIRSDKRLTEEGLFRLPGQTNEVKDLQDAYDMGDRPIFPTTTDVHTVASLLKCYLRELPEPVIPFEQYDTLLNAAKVSQTDDGTKDAGRDVVNEMQEVRKIIKEQVNILPQSNFDLLRYLCQFLDEVQGHSAANKMDISNLALVFGPNLMRAKEENALAMMADQSHVQRIVYYFIDSHEFFFPDDENSSKHSITSSSLGRMMDEAHLNGDAGIGTLTTASPGCTLALRRAGDDSGTGSLDATPHNTHKRAPPIPAGPPPMRKPLKPNRRRQSAQSSGSNESVLLNSDDVQRKSYYDNVTGPSGAADADSVSNSSIHAVAGSVEGLNSPRSTSAQYDPTRSGHPTPDRLNKKHGRTNDEFSSESAPPTSRTQSGSSMRGTSFHRTSEENEASIQHMRTASYPTNKFTGPIGVVGDTRKRSDRLSVSSASDESSVLSLPVVPPKVNQRKYRHGENQRSPRMDTDQASSDRRSTSSSFSDKRSHPSPNISARPPTYKELEQQVESLKDELQKKQVENVNRVKMLEEHYLSKRNSIFQSSMLSVSGGNDEIPGLPPSDVESAADIWDPNSALGRRLSVESQAETKYREEAKRHAMTKIQLRNAERGLKQAEERNKQLQKEMGQFFESFGGMLNQPPS